MTKVLLIILFFSLPLIHGRIFPTLGLDIYLNVSGNFEFTKAIFFNVFSGVIFLSFFVEKLIMQPLSFFKGENSSVDSNYRVIIGIILLILFLSTIFSVSPFTSIIGDLEKGHTALMSMNLLGLFLILKNQDKDFLKKLIFTSLLSGVLASLLAIKELYLPTYDYGALGNRALGSFGHPNYLAGYLLLLLPFISPFVKGSTRSMRGRDWIFFLLILLGIILSKSLVAIVLAIGYLTLKLFSIPSPLRRGLGGGIAGGFFILGMFLIIKYAPEKLHSFLSRFYLWETTLRIIFSDIKIFLIGGGAESLPYFFDSFKVPEVYIYENYGFTADRPHNFILNIFYHFGIFALGLFLYGVYIFGKYFTRSPENIAILLFLFFGIIHYFSVASYLLLIAIVTITLNTNRTVQIKQQYSIQNYIIFPPLIIISLIGGYFSIKLYYSEVMYSEKKYVEASENIIHPRYLIKTSDFEKAAKIEHLISQKSFKSQISQLPEKQNLCNHFTINYPSAENHIYCGNIFWNLGKTDLAKQYYNIGLQKLPDLWNQDSIYWESYFAKNTITGNRFFSEKFGDINLILEREKN